jgi:TolC family type I secretion outer membrane protein
MALGDRWLAGTRAGTVFTVVLLLAPSGRAQERKTLEECIAIALANHPTLKSAQASVDAARSRVWQAVSGYLPAVSGSYVARRRKTSTGIETGTDEGTATQTRTSSFYRTGVGFTQVLFDFGQNLAAIRAARAEERSLRADWTTEEQTVVFNVKQAFFNILAARRLLAVADETVAQTDKQLEDAVGRHDVGLAPRFDVTRAQVQLANAELNQLTARNNLAVARETLRNALGLDAPLDFELVDSLETSPVPLSEEAAVTAAYAQRPELQSIRELQIAADEQIAQLQRDYLPRVSSDGSYRWAGSMYPLQDNWDVGAQVSVSIFNGGLTTAQLAEARANLNKLEFDERTLAQSIALEVRQAVLDATQAGERIDVAAKGAAQARDNLEVAEARYQTGVGNIIELTDARAALATADAESVRALYDYQIAIAALERATGAPRPAGSR